MSINTKTINREVVKPFKLANGYPDHKILGHRICSEPYANIYICAKKKSGKTSLIGKILTKCANKRTTVVIFSSTVYKDKTWEAIVQKLKQKKVTVELHMSTKENGVDVIQQYTEYLQHEAYEESLKRNQPRAPKLKHIVMDSDDEEQDKAERSKPRKLAAEYIFVFDDLNIELQNNKQLDFLTSRNRHFKSKTIISSQYWNALSKASRMNQDYVIIFGGIPEEKLQQIHEETDMAVEFAHFLSLYYHATAEKYCFLYVNLREEEYRRNLNEKYEV